MKRPEVLSPAGDLEKLKTAVLYGADAVYMSGKQFGLHRVVIYDSPFSYAYSGVISSQLLDELPGGIGCHPAGVSVSGGDLSVEGHGDLEGYPRLSFRDILEEDTVLFKNLSFAQPSLDHDSVLPEDGDPFSSDKRIGIGGSDDDSCDPGFDKGVSAWRLLTMVAAWLQSYIGGGSCRVFSAVPKGFAFCMEVAIFAVPATS